MIAFVLIPAATVAALLGQVATGWLRRKGEGTWWVLALGFAFTTSGMVQALGALWWGSLLIITFIVIAGWHVAFPGLLRGDNSRR